MAGRGPRWDGAAGVVVLLALGVAQASLGLALDRGSNCNASQYEEPGGGGGCCAKCPPGQKLKTECSAESPTVCEACESGHFQAGWTREKHCVRHEDCDPNAGFFVYREGNATENAECRCQNGTHCSSHECHTCRLNKRCGVGEGVQEEASHVTDTVCAPCPSGFFSDIESATAWCQPWSSCQDQNLLLKENGTSGSDVVCGPLLSVPRDTQRSHLLLLWLLLLPLTILLLGGAAFCLRRHRDVWKPLPNKGQEPAENEEDCPALPIQETLLGAKSTPRDLSKDSRSVELEQV